MLLIKQTYTILAMKMYWILIYLSIKYHKLNFLRNVLPAIYKVLNI